MTEVKADYLTFEELGTEFKFRSGGHLVASFTPAEMGCIFAAAAAALPPDDPLQDRLFKTSIFYRREVA